MEILEHGIYMLLLLVGILIAQPPRPKLALTLIVVGVLLAFIPPVVSLPVPWDVSLALTIPLLLWQNGRRLVEMRWRWDRLEMSLWALTVVGLAAVLVSDVNITWLGALLFGLIVASMLWRAMEPDHKSGFISHIGPLTLVVLLVEIAPTVETPDRYVGGLFSGAAFGIVISFLAFRLARRVAPRWQELIAIGQVYLAYGLGLIGDSSSVTAALLSVMVYIGSGIHFGLWKDGRITPAPTDTWPGFGLLLILFLFLGWETHRPLTAWLVLEITLGIAVGLIIALIGWGWRVPVS